MEGGLTPQDIARGCQVVVSDRPLLIQLCILGQLRYSKLKAQAGLYFSFFQVEHTMAVQQTSVQWPVGGARINGTRLCLIFFIVYMSGAKTDGWY